MSTTLHRTRGFFSTILFFLFRLCVFLSTFLVVVEAKKKKNNHHSHEQDAVPPDDDTLPTDDQVFPDYFPDHDEEGEADHSEHGHQHELTLALKIHISCMLLGWGLLIPSGICAAHFWRHDYRTTTEGWFRWHFCLNTTGLALALVGWLTAIFCFHVFDNDHKHTRFYQHGVLGMTTMALGLLQPVNALLRPSNHPTLCRQTWNYIHKSSGYACWLLSVATILWGLPLTTASGLLQNVYLGMLVFLALLISCLWYDQFKLERADEEVKFGHSLPEVEFMPIVAQTLT